MTLCTTWINAINFSSVALTAISFCNLLHHNTGNPAYVITYPVRDMEYSELSESAWYHPLAE